MEEGSVEPTTVDATAGGLVWVRRRNGSWWPGRIMGADELSCAGLVTTKQGTPIKLLGREDASVDWYNLEKSKRIKPFRCGEYDDCIEKAKAAATNSSRRAVKYCRREDAILHALALESALLLQEPPSLYSQMEKSSANKCPVKHSPVISNSSEENGNMGDESSSFNVNSNLPLKLSQPAFSFEEPNQFGTSMELSVDGRLQRTPNDSDDDGMETAKRMRGLNDLGMGTESSLKRVGSLVARVPDIVKRKDRRRSMNKVLENSALVTVPVMFEQQLPYSSGSVLPGFSDSKISGLGSNESRRSLSVVLNNSDSTGVSCNNGFSFNASAYNSDAFLINGEQKDNDVTSMSDLPDEESFDELYDVPLLNEEDNPSVLGSFFATCSSQKHRQTGSGAQSSQSSQVETLSLGNEELNESGSTSSAAVDIGTFINPKIEYASSTWQTKGKRKMARFRRQYHVESEDVDDDDESDDYSVQPRSFPSLKKPCFTMAQKYRPPSFPVANHDFEFCLFDVDVEVEVNSGGGGYRPQHVPYISLMSKVHGRPIIGHPLAVDVLDNGVCDIMVIRSKTCFPSGRYEEEEDMDYEMKPKHQIRGHFSPSKAPKIRKGGLKMRTLSSLACSDPGGDKAVVGGRIKKPAISFVPLNLVFSRFFSPPLSRSLHSN